MLQKKQTFGNVKHLYPMLEKIKKMAKLELMAVVGFAGCVEAEQLWKETPPPQTTRDIG